MSLPPDLAITLNQYFQSSKKVKIQCLLSDKKFYETIEEYDFNIDYKVVHTDPVIFDKYTYTSYTVSNTITDEILGRFQSLQACDELYVFTGSSAHFFNNTVLRILIKLYPKILLAFIHSNGIYEILKLFEKKWDMPLYYKNIVRKTIFGKTPRTQREWEIAKEGRTYSSFHQPFSESENKNIWVDSIQVFSKRQSGKNFQFTISRKGLVTIDRGRFDVVFSDVLQHIVGRCKKQREQFEHRSRSEQPDKSPKPLIVRFGKSIFEKPETRKEFSKILTRYTNCTYSIVHSGNPHVYLSILDRNDNSSFTVRTYGVDSLLLIPQIKTSAQSLMRFSEFLVSSFYEGVIENFE